MAGDDHEYDHDQDDEHRRQCRRWPTALPLECKQPVVGVEQLENYYVRPLERFHGLRFRPD
jgi:hypothetical protein